MQEKSIKELFLNSEIYQNQELTFSAWVASNRGNKKIRFLAINDGSTVENLQVTFKGENFDFNLLDQIHIGAKN